MKFRIGSGSVVRDDTIVVAERMINESVEEIALSLGWWPMMDPL